MNDSDEKDRKPKKNSKEKPCAQARGLSKKDQALWDAYMGAPEKEEESFEKLLNQEAVKPRVAKKKKLSPRQEKTSDKNIAPAPKNTQMDRRTEEKLRKGQISIEATLDLHGMVQREAYPALENFMTRAVQRKLRCVLVITGKGKSKLATDNIIEPEQGVLKKNVPHWLKSSSINTHILKIVPAHVKHGGSGALYIYLRRQR